MGQSSGWPGLKVGGLRAGRGAWLGSAGLGPGCLPKNSISNSTAASAHLIYLTSGSTSSSKRSPTSTAATTFNTLHDLPFYKPCDRTTDAPAGTYLGYQASKSCRFPLVAAITASDGLPPVTASLSRSRGIETVGSVLFDPSFTSRPQPEPRPHFIVDEASSTAASMDGKRHLSSFQQLEKLGEGTYATVSPST